MNSIAPTLTLRQRLARVMPCLAWPRPSRTLLHNEAIAGITVALMVIPQGVAYAALAGMPLVTGVYAALWPALVAVLFSSSQRLSVGPTALTSLLVGASLAPLAVAGSDEWVSMAVWLTLLSGGIQILIGAGRFGWMLRLVNSPVLTGFTQGAAILIAVSQLPSLLGYTGRTIPQVLQGGAPPDWTAMAFGLGSMAVLWAGKRWLPRFPTTMALVAGAAAISGALSYALLGGAVVGALPSGLPGFYWPGGVPLSTLGTLLLPALTITLVSFLETASSAKIDNARAGTLWNENQDPYRSGSGQGGVGPDRRVPDQLVVLALGHHALCGRADRLGHPLQRGGGRDRPGVAHAAAVPRATGGARRSRHDGHPRAHQAAQLRCAVARVARGRRHRARHLRADDRDRAIDLLGRARRPAREPGELHVPPPAPAHHRSRAARRRQPAATATCGTCRRSRQTSMRCGWMRSWTSRRRARWSAPSPRRWRQDRGLTDVCLFAQPINRIDITGAEVFGSIRRLLEGKGVRLHLSGLKLPAQQVLDRAGLLGAGPLFCSYRTDADALLALTGSRPPASA